MSDYDKEAGLTILTSEDLYEAVLQRSNELKLGTTTEVVEVENAKEIERLKTENATLKEALTILSTALSDKGHDSPVAVKFCDGSDDSSTIGFPCDSAVTFKLDNNGGYIKASLEKYVDGEQLLIVSWNRVVSIDPQSQNSVILSARNIVPDEDG